MNGCMGSVLCAAVLIQIVRRFGLAVCGFVFLCDRVVCYVLCVVCCVLCVMRALTWGLKSF